MGDPPSWISKNELKMLFEYSRIVIRYPCITEMREMSNEVMNSLKRLNVFFI